MSETEPALTADERLQIAGAIGIVLRQGYWGPAAYLTAHEGTEHVIFEGGLDGDDDDA